MFSDNLLHVFCADARTPNMWCASSAAKARVPEWCSPSPVLPCPPSRKRRLGSCPSNPAWQVGSACAVFFGGGPKLMELA